MSVSSSAQVALGGTTAAIQAKKRPRAKTGAKQPVQKKKKVCDSVLIDRDQQQEQISFHSFVNVYCCMLVVYLCYTFNCTMSPSVFIFSYKPMRVTDH